MRISDWSSDVCSSDLLAGAHLTTGPRWATHRVSFHAAHHRRNLDNANHHSKLSHHTRRPYALGQAADLCGAGRPSDRRSTAGQADRTRTRLNSSPNCASRMPSSACKKPYTHNYKLSFY